MVFLQGKKYEDACELYQNAGNAYKVGGFTLKPAKPTTRQQLC
jgi:hypothetical protein